MKLNYIDIFNIRKNNKKPKEGRILISEPFLYGDIFRRSVVLITSYSKEEGTMGIILNKPIKDTKLQKRIKKELKFNELDIEVFIGGPVGTEQLFYLHKLNPQVLPESIQVKDNIYWGGNFEILKDKLINGLVKPNEVKFFVGYSGWAPGQLEDEIDDRNAWLVEEIDEDEIMNIDIENIWSKKINQLDEKYKLWSIVPEYPILN